MKIKCLMGPEALQNWSLGKLRIRRKLVYGVILLAVTARPTPVLAEAGWSEAARARSLWIREPFALVKSGDKATGPDTVALCRGRPATHRDFLSLGGIVVGKNLVENIDSYLENEGLLIMKLIDRRRQFATINLDDADASPRFYSDLESLPENLQTLCREASFRTFDDSYRYRLFLTFIPYVGIAGAAFAAVHFTRLTKKRPRW